MMLLPGALPVALVCFVLPLLCLSDKTLQWCSLVCWRFVLFLPLGSLPLMRNRDGLCQEWDQEPGCAGAEEWPSSPAASQAPVLAAVGAGFCRRSESVPFLRHWPVRLLPSQRRLRWLGTGWGEEGAWLQPANTHTLCAVATASVRFFWVLKLWVRWIRWKCCAFGKGFCRWKEKG